MSCRGSGFSLVELLVVIAIVSLLIGLLMPALGAARKAADVVEAGSGVRTLMQAYVLYSQDHSGFVLPAHLRPDQALDGIEDEFGNLITPPASQRWVYRLGPYFDHGWGGTTHVGNRAALLREQDDILNEPDGLFFWSYQVSVFPSFGINRRFVGGDYSRQSWIQQGYHIRRTTEAFMPSELLVFCSSRFYVGDTKEDGFIHVDPPPLDAVYDEDQQTNAPATAFGYVHPRYQGKPMVGWLDGHADVAGLHVVADRRHWSNAAWKRADDRWDPEK